MPPDSSMGDLGNEIVDGCGIMFRVFLAAW